MSLIVALCVVSASILSVDAPWRSAHHVADRSNLTKSHEATNTGVHIVVPDGWIRKAVAEAIGAFALVFVVTLVITSSGDDLGATALAYGLTMAVFVAALAHVSGGHFNPAVTLAMCNQLSAQLMLRANNALRRLAHRASCPG